MGNAIPRPTGAGARTGRRPARAAAGALRGPRPEAPADRGSVRRD